MPNATLTKRIEFCASHRYHNPAWDAETNRRVFGPCNNERSHGHNYLLEVTLRGEIDPVTGMIINIYDLKQYLWDVLEQFDHKHLNLDTPYFQQTIPTTENFAHVLWRCFSRHPQIPAVDRVRLYEDEDLYAEVTREHLSKGEIDGCLYASVARQYWFSACHRTDSSQLVGHDYAVEITVQGPIRPETGQVVSLSELDTLVDTRVLQRFQGKELNHDPAFRERPVSEATLSRVIWDALNHHVPVEQVSRVAVRTAHRLEACYVREATRPSDMAPIPS